MSFRHAPLQHPDEIRLLVLHPGPRFGYLEATLKHRRLADATTSATFSTPLLLSPWRFEVQHEKLNMIQPLPYGAAQRKKQKIKQVELCKYETCRARYGPSEYDALSYTWGDPNITDDLLIDGRRLAITKNLLAALEQLRDPAKPRVLWVDAVCIDQRNVQERNHQVRLMRAVFSQASTIIIWLGGSSSQCQGLEDLIQAFRCKTHSKPLLKHSPTALQGLSDLFSRPWWKRIWIVQEVVAARDIIVAIGHLKFSWDTLRDIANSIQLNEFSSNSAARYLENCHYANFMKLDNLRGRKKMPLITCLQCTRDHKATDPRDKLYALLGLASDVSKDELIPDYSLPVQDVYLSLTKFMVGRKNNLDILACSGTSISAQGMPSWMPDWRITPSVAPLTREEVDGDRFDATKGFHAAATLDWPSRKLMATGIILDGIEFFGGDVKRANGSRSTIQRWLYIAEQQVGTNSVTNDFWRTIITDRDHLGRSVMTPHGRAAGFWRFFRPFINGDSAPGVQQFSDAVTRAVVGRRFFITKRGHMGLGPRDIQQGDRVVLIFGCSVPLILRNTGVKIVVVGEAYISGFMRGELRLGNRKLNSQFFVLE